MESAVDQHLRCPRTMAKRVADDYQPPFPMYVARADVDLTRVSMGYFGVQFKDATLREAALLALRKIVADFDHENGPGNHDLTFHQDNQGYGNFIVVGYWRDFETYERWCNDASIASWWAAPERLTEKLGYFRECVAPDARQFETLYAFQTSFPGVGAVMDRTSGEIQEHGYWGSMRDRFALSQNDPMEANGILRRLEHATAEGTRVVIHSHDNLALIRSGQDWRNAGDAERTLYLDRIEPTLRNGMDFLRDNGEEVGCYSNRYVQSIDIDGNLQDESYNIGHWKSLRHLEAWAESHPTHLRIFGVFFEVIAGIRELRLYHEVSVFDGTHQFYEYINCHPGTGMMRDAA
ncbi:phenylacetaldoxime dehydratase family protein [Asaia bogorensis]|uniref:phenylacetaldoxime dehydratase family protein n=1 Tax=Asaia bogorensis TaxID=91915 RepID=UPI000EFA8A3F|nr:phenylacetaldoxime dehydratase family protein [Asaia bogorensis]